jgi:EmrB/QacA subfamily drug resistance transporter
VTSTVTRPEQSERRGRLPKIRPQHAVAVAYVTSMFMGAMDNHIVNVALPTLSRDFHSSIAAVQWTVIAYVLSLAIWIPASGWIGDRIGTKRTFLIALVLFTVASACCGQARNLPELIASRALQGTGGGMLTPSATAMLWRAYPPAQRARLARLLILPILVAPAAAPVVGGLLIEKLSWRWAFYVNLPVGIVAVIFSALYLVEHRQSAESHFDFWGFVLSGGGLAAILYAISEGSLVGWTSAPILIAAVVGIAAVAAFIRLELARPDDPLLKVRLLSDRLFRATNITVACSTASFLGVLYITPIFLQEALHQSPLQSGLTTFVEAFGVVLSTQTLGRLYSRVGPRRMSTAGLILLTLITISLTFVGSGTNLWVVRGVMFLAGFANSTAFLPLQTSMFTQIAPADIGHASAIFNTQRQSALAIGVAIISTVVAGYHGSRVDAFHFGYFAAAAIAVMGAVTCFTMVHDADAAATMVRSRVTVPVVSE